MSQDTLAAAGLLRPGQIIYPEVSISTAKELIKTHFGYSTKRITALNSYDDKNFFVEASPVRSSNEDDDKPATTRKFVFKVLNSMDSTKQHVVAENAAMLFLNSKGIGCPVPEPSLHTDKTTCPLVEIPCKTDIDNNEQSTGKFHVIRLLSFVEGQILTDVPITTKMLYELGTFSASLVSSFENFSHPGLTNHNSVWFLTSTHYLKEFIYVIQSEPDKFKMVTEVLDAFTTRVVPMYPKLRKGVIHGDMNEQNIIVNKVQNESLDNQNNILSEENGSVHYAVSGVIDFGDLQINFYVFELAVLVAYMMLECLKSDIDPLVGSAHVIAGFHSKIPIPAHELDILRICICSRICQSVVLGRYSYTLDPSNQYLLTTAKAGWILLDKLWNETTDEQLFSVWKKIVPDLTLA